jgi:hypothetical protein
LLLRNAEFGVVKPNHRLRATVQTSVVQLQSPNMGRIRFTNDLQWPLHAAGSVVLDLVRP